MITKEKSTCMDFSDALRAVKAGEKIKRSSWDNMSFVVYQKGYPNGIPCNKNTAEAWGINEGDKFRCNPYLQIQLYDESKKDVTHSMYNPSNDDILADDWVTIEVLVE